jgi:uncharacterized membrane protein
MEKPLVCETCRESGPFCTNEWTWDDVGQFSVGFSVIAFWVAVAAWMVSREVNKK